MRNLAKFAVFSYWIVSAVIYAALTDFYIGIVLSAGTTAVVGFAIEYWTGAFTERENQTNEE